MPPTHAESLREATRLAQGGNPSKALELLQAIDPGHDAALHHYTLGALHLQLGRPGEALAHLLRAKALGAPAEQVTPTLIQARGLAEAKAGSASLERASTQLERLGDGPIILPLESLFATLALVAALRLWKKPARGPARRRRLLVGSLLAAFALGLAAVHGAALLSPPARALAQLEIRSGPGEDFPLLAEAIAGTELRVTSASPMAGWIRVRVSPELEGWAESVRVLPLTGAMNPDPTVLREQRP